MSAGGSLSPLIGVLYLLPLDQAMHMYATKSGIFYVRYMDDIIVLSKKHWHLRTAIAIIQTTTVSLGLKMHKKTKCFIGRVEKGFDFLGYSFSPILKLRPSNESLNRLLTRASRLYEHGGDIDRLWLYVTRWTNYIRCGLKSMISHAGGTKRYFVYVLCKLKIKNVKMTNFSNISMICC